MLNWTVCGRGEWALRGFKLFYLLLNRASNAKCDQNFTTTVSLQWKKRGEESSAFRMTTMWQPCFCNFAINHHRMRPRDKLFLLSFLRWATGRNTVHYTLEPCFKSLRVLAMSCGWRAKTRQKSMGIAKTLVEKTAPKFWGYMLFFLFFEGDVSGSHSCSESDGGGEYGASCLKRLQPAAPAVCLWPLGSATANSRKAKPP